MTRHRIGWTYPKCHTSTPLVMLAAVLISWATGVPAQQNDEPPAAPAPAGGDQDPASEPKADQPAGQNSEPEVDIQAAELGDGRLIRIRLPITGNADAHIKTSIDRALDQLARLPRREGRRPALILEIVPDRRRAQFGEGTDFTRALSVADYLMRKEVAAVKTIAYVP